MSTETAPPIAVVIPVRNARPFIRAAVQSALDQTRPPEEIVVVDDGSTDGSGAAVAHIDPRVKVVSPPGPRHGASLARNIGVANCRSPLIAFLDADDLSRPRRFERQAHALSRHPDAAMAFCDLEYLDASGNPTGTVIDFPEFNPHGFFGQLLERNRIGSTSAAMVRRSVFEAVNGFDEKIAYNEEYDLWLRIARRHPVEHIPRPDLLYRLHPGNISRFQEEQRRNAVKAVAKYDDETIMTALVDTHRDYMAALLALAQIYFKLERFDDCRKALDRWSGDYALESFLRGNLALKHSHPADALDHFEKCVKTDPAFAAGWNNLGICRWAQGDKNGAEAAIRMAATLKADYWDARNNLQTLRSSGHWTEMHPTWVQLRRRLKPE